MSAPVENVTARFRRQWILRFASLSLLGSVVLLFTLRRLFTMDLGKSYKTAFLILKNLQGQLIPIVGLSLLFYVLMVSVMATVIILYLSHAIAGPLFRVERVAERLRRGDLTCRAAAREKDQLVELTATVQELVDGLSRQLTPLPPHLEAIEKAWTDLDGLPPESRHQSIAELVATIESNLEEMQKHLGD